MTKESKYLITEPRLGIFGIYSAIAGIYCASFSWIYFYIAQSALLGYVHLIALAVVVLNWLIAITTKNFQLGTNIILADGTMVVSFLFATGGWEGSGYLWPFAYLPYAAFLTTRAGGIFWIASLFTINLLLIALNFIGVINIPYSNVEIFNYITAFIVFWVCIYFFQKELEKYRELNAEKQADLEKRNLGLMDIEKMTNLGDFEWIPEAGKMIWSDELYRIYGVTPEKFVPTFEEFLGRAREDKREKVKTEIERVYKDGGDFEFEEVIIRPDGSERVLYTRGRAIKNDEGKVVKLIGACLDITEEKNAERALMNKAKELSDLNRFMMGREARMAELKEELEKLKRKK